MIEPNESFTHMPLRGETEKKALRNRFLLRALAAAF